MRARTISRVEIRVMCHNERATIREVIERSLAAFAGTRWQLQIEVIDDGSDDGSAELVRETWDDGSPVTVTSFGEHRGLGAVLRRAFRPTEADAVVLLCSDLQFAPEDVLPLVEALEDADLAFALRPNRADRQWRVSVSSSEGILTRLLLGRWWRDVHWVRGVRAWVLEDCRFEANSPIIDVELAVHAEALGARTVALPLPHHPRRVGRGHGASFENLAHSALDLARLAWRSRWRRSASG